MKYLSLLPLLIFPALCEALTCTNYEPPSGKAIQLELDGGVTYFTVPATLEGQRLESVTLWAYPLGRDASGELVAPLAFKAAGDSMKGHFVITAPFLEAEITATYSKDVCGPRLVSSVGI